MSVSAEIAQHLIGSAERWFAVDNPVGNEKPSEKTPKKPGLSKTLE
jgi:hypothetical protein